MPRAVSPVPLIAAFCVAEIFGMTGAVTFPALLPTFIDTWALSNTDAGWINGIYYAGYLFAVPVLVSLTDRVAPRRVFFLCMAITVLANLGFALAAEGLWTAMAFRLVAGIGLAGTYMPGLKLLGDHLRILAADKDQSRAVAFYTSSFGIGTSLSYFLAGEVAAALDWRWAFGIAAAGPVVAAALMAAVLPREDPPHAQVPDTHLLDFRPVLRCRAVMGYVLAYTAQNFELFAYRSWIVAYLAFAAATGPGGVALSATAIAALVNLLGLPASVLGNELARRIGRHRTITIVMLTSALLAGSIGFAAGAPFALVVVLCLVYGVTITADSSAITAGVVNAAPAGYRGATMAVHSCIGFTGAFAGPLTFGVVLDLSGAGATGGETIQSWGLTFLFSGLVTVVLGTVALAVLGRKRA